jgi:branched-chain amino acid transport system permease protein
MGHDPVLLASLGSFFQTNASTVQTMLVDALLAFSVQICLRAGVFSLGSVAFWSLGGYTAGIMAKHGQPTVLAFVVVIAGAVVLGAVMSVALARLHGLYLAMATVALDLVVVVLITNATSITGGAEGLFAIPVRLGTGWTIGLVAVAAGALALTERGRAGRVVRVMRNDSDVAAALGIRVRRVERAVFVASAVLGALSGACYALLFSTIQPNQGGFSAIVTALTIVVLGGMETWVGGLVGAVVVVGLPLWATPISTWTGVIYGGAIIMVAMVAPRGLVGLVQDGVRQAVNVGRGRGRGRRDGHDVGAPASGDAAAIDVPLSGATQGAP